MPLIRDRPSKDTTGPRRAEVGGTQIAPAGGATMCEIERTGMCQLDPYPLLALLRPIREIWLAQSSVLPFSPALFRADSADQFDSPPTGSSAVL